MTQPYIFMTDSDSDLYYEVADAREITVVKMPYVLEGVEYYDDNGRLGEEHQHMFFQKMREGAVPVTACLSKDNYIDYFEPVVKEGKDILFVSFSSQMSNTLTFAGQARDELMEKYPGRKILIVDTMSISVPMAMMIEDAHDLYRAGASMEEIKKWILENRFFYQCYMTVEDLVYLKRGGRLSPTSALFGTMLNIKPIIVMGKNGKMDALGKVKGRKNALQYIVDKTVENILEPEKQTVTVAHADCLAEAEKVRDMLTAKIAGIGDITVRCIGPVIGSHCGPGSIAIVFRGKERP